VAAELSPDHAVVWSGRGNAEFDLGEFRQAIASYDRAADLEPPSPYLLERRAVAHLRLGDPADAERDLSKALAIQMSARALVERGVAYQLLGDDARAIADWERVIRASPAYPDVPALRRAVALARARAAQARTGD
jgi:tetratricopeptide (TPR) repeat protein